MFPLMKKFQIRITKLSLSIVKPAEAVLQYVHNLLYWISLLSLEFRTVLISNLGWGWGSLR